MKIPPTELRQLIKDNRDIVDFAPFGEGVDEDTIERAEAALEIRLPPSYRWWLRHYGGGEILGEEIYSIYEQDFDSVMAGDIVYQYRLQTTGGDLEPGRLPICYSGIDGSFVFDLRERAPDGELPVIAEATGEVYASDFSEFLAKRVALGQDAS